MNSQVYKTVLEEHLIPFMEKHGTTMFLQDGAPCHTSNMIKNFLAEEDIQLIDWPGNSPDLNPIENCWNYVKDKLEDRHTPNLKALIDNIKDLWCRRTETEYLRNLVSSMPRRMAMAIQNNGYSTKY